MSTAYEIITQASKKAGILGVGQTLTNEDTNDALIDLNNMIGQWRRKRWLLWHLLDVAFVSTGAQFYTVGPGGNYNIPRPDRIEAGFLRQVTQPNPNQIDYPLKILPSREDYNRIAIKQLQSFPEWLFYDSVFPIGILYPWPVPQASIYEVHITVKDTLLAYPDLKTDIALPPEYKPALIYNLAVRINAGYPGVQINPEVKNIAIEALNVIRGANAQIPMLVMPKDLTRPGIYDIFSDRNY